MRIITQIFWLLTLNIAVFGQPTETKNTSDKPDSTYIAQPSWHNDFRVLYGTKGSSLVYGSKNQTGNSTSTSFYNNVIDVVGFGATYKFIDFDLAFSLPQTKLLDEGLQNLKQFRLSGSYYGRKLIIGGYWTDSQGLVIADAAGEFQSSPDVHLVRIGLQFTYNFNSTRYSFKAANFQNELQRRSSGSFLLRAEPFYRKIGVGVTLVPSSRDIAVTYGDQVGLHYVSSPGISILPGYGYNFVWKSGKYFVSPIVMAGAGVAVSAYRGPVAEHVVLNTEWMGMATLNMGYNGSRMYVVLRSYYEMRYFQLNPSYFTTAEIRVGITAGYRFGDLEKFIPGF